MKTNLPRLAASNYSNSAPLIWSFWRGSRRTKVEYLPDAAPAKCAAMLKENLVDAALTPVVEYQRIRETLIVPNVCVAAKKQVQSVILVTKGADLKSAESIALDVSSKTSVALTQIIFREFFDKAPAFVAHESDVEKMLETTDVALLIGDPALRVDRQKYRVFDIVELWREFTGGGFVFAFWLANRNAVETVGQIDFAAARDEGLQKIPEILDFYQKDVALERADFEKYLTESICYSMDDELFAGLQLFYQLAHKHRLIENIKPISFL